MHLSVKRLVSTAKLPERAHPTDAGLDLFSIEDCTIHCGEIVRVRTGIAVAIDPCWPTDHWPVERYDYGVNWTYAFLFWDKSGLASRGLKVVGGVIDESYRGELIVLLANVGDGAVTIAAGWKVAQLIAQRVELPAIVEVQELDDTVRGSGGFGSTGS